MSGLGEAGTPQLVVWDVCGRKQFFLLYIAITLLIRITEAMRAPEQVEKKGWFGLYAMKHSIFMTTTSIGYNMRPFAWESGNPRYQLHRISHCITHLLLCHVLVKRLWIKNE